MAVEKSNPTGQNPAACKSPRPRFLCGSLESTACLSFGPRCVNSVIAG